MNFNQLKNIGASWIAAALLVVPFILGVPNTALGQTEAQRCMVTGIFEAQVQRHFPEGRWLDKQQSKVYLHQFNNFTSGGVLGVSDFKGDRLYIAPADYMVMTAFGPQQKRGFKIWLEEGGLVCQSFLTGVELYADIMNKVDDNDMTLIEQDEEGDKI